MMTKYPQGKCPRCDKWNYVNDWGFAQCNRCCSMYEPNNIWQPPIIFTEDLDLVFTFGKYKGESVVTNLDYCQWVLKGPFPDWFKNDIRTIMEAVRHGRI